MTTDGEDVRALARAVLAGGLLGAGDVLGEPGPELVGRYEVLRVLGREGGAQALLAHDPERDLRVAVTWFDRPLPGFVHRLRALAEDLARCRHPSVAAPLDLGVADDRPFVVTKWIDAPTLAAGWPRGPDEGADDGAGPGSALDQALDLVDAVAAACEAAHARGVLHLDLGPERVLGTRPPLVLGFGLAAAAGSAWPALAPAPRRLAPELARGEAPGPAADVYGLGGLLLEALTGRAPWSQAEVDGEADGEDDGVGQADGEAGVAGPAGDAGAVVGDAAGGAPRAAGARPDAPRGPVPEALLAVARRALAAAPADRFASVAELRRALRAARGGGPPGVAASAPGRSGGALELLASVALGLALGVALGLALGRAWWGRAAPPAPAAPAPATGAGPTPGTAPTPAAPAAPAVTDRPDDPGGAGPR